MKEKRKDVNPKMNNASALRDASLVIYGAQLLYFAAVVCYDIQAFFAAEEAAWMPAYLGNIFIAALSLAFLCADHILLHVRIGWNPAGVKTNGKAAGDSTGKDTRDGTRVSVNEELSGYGIFPALVRGCVLALILYHGDGAGIIFTIALLIASYGFFAAGTWRRTRPDAAFLSCAISLAFVGLFMMILGIEKEPLRTSIMATWIIDVILLCSAVLFGRKKIWEFLSGLKVLRLILKILAPLALAGAVVTAVITVQSGYYDKPEEIKPGPLYTEEDETDIIPQVIFVPEEEVLTAEDVDMVYFLDGYSINLEDSSIDGWFFLKEEDSSTMEKSVCLRNYDTGIVYRLSTEGGKRKDVAQFFDSKDYLDCAFHAKFPDYTVQSGDYELLFEISINGAEPIYVDSGEILEVKTYTEYSRENAETEGEDEGTADEAESSAEEGGSNE